MIGGRSSPAQGGADAAFPGRRQELRSEGRGVSERSAKSEGGGFGLLLLYPAHHHAEVGRFQHHGHPARSENRVERLRDLTGQALLHLKAPREHVDQARDLGEADHPARGEVGHVGAAVEGKQVMFAQGEELDAPHEDHVFTVFFEDRAAHGLLRAPLHPGGEEGEGPSNPLGGAFEPVASGVLAERIEDCRSGLGHAFGGRRGGEGEGPGRAAHGVLQKCGEPVLEEERARTTAASQPPGSGPWRTTSAEPRSRSRG